MEQAALSSSRAGLLCHILQARGCWRTESQPGCGHPSFLTWVPHPDGPHSLPSPRDLHPLFAPGRAIHHSAPCPQAGQSHSYQMPLRNRCATPPPSPAPSLPAPRQKGAEIMNEAPLSMTMKKRTLCS